MFSSPTPHKPIFPKMLNWVAVALLSIWAIVQLYPLVFLFITALKSDPEILSNPFGLPAPPKFDSFARVLAGDQIGQSFLTYFTNSLIVTGSSLILLVLLSAMAGYALARGRFPGSRFIQQVFLMALAVPVHVLAVPVFFLFGDLGLRNSLLGVILLYVSLGLPFTIILMRSYFLSFPVELEEAARLDGCSRTSTFFRIVLPVSKSALASMAIINLSWIWSELFFALTLLDRLEVRTLPLAIASYQPTSMATESAISELFAIMALTVIPMLIFYAIFQKQIRSGMTSGAIK